MPYHYLPEVAIADIAFEATGRDLEELFQSAGDAVMNTMIDNLDAIEPREQRRFLLENDALDLLLFNFMGEFIYYKDAEQLLLRPGKVKIEKTDGLFRLTGEANGETLAPQRHHQRVDVKAVTLHRFHLEQSAEGWTAFVILDI